VVVPNPTTVERTSKRPTTDETPTFCAVKETMPALES